MVFEDVRGFNEIHLRPLNSWVESRRAMVKKFLKQIV